MLDTETEPKKASVTATTDDELPDVDENSVQSLSEEVHGVPIDT
jgi:mitochondrial import receptor subunit TOM70